MHQLAIQGGPNAISVAGMPLDLALALLRDPQGDIALPIPLEYGEQGASAGHRHDPARRAARRDHGRRHLADQGDGRAAARGRRARRSPSRRSRSPPGDATAPPDAAEKLAPLASLLAQRPGLGLALVGHAGPDDRLALAERILIERIAADRGLPALDDAGFFARRRVQGALEERGRGEAGALEPEDQALLARYLEATDVPAERYTDLARRRAEAVRDVLATAHALAPPRVVAEAGSEAAAPEVVPELRVGAAQ